MADQQPLTPRVEQALLDTLSDTLPGPVTGFVAHVSYLEANGDPSYLLLEMPGQRLGQSIGLASQLIDFFRWAWQQHLADPE